jgi:hypothetical protein
MLAVPSIAVVRDSTSTSIYVHTRERFECRQVAVGQTFGNLVSSFSASPDNEASMNESDGCASASLDRIVCDNQRRSAKDDRDHDDNDEPHEHVACHKGASFKSRGCLLIE